MIAAVRAEWTKLRTLPSTAWLLIAAAATTIAASAIVAAAWHVNRGSTADPTRISLSGIYVGQAVIAVLTVLAISEEYGTGMIRTTLTAMPQRVKLLTAKAATLAGLTVPVGLIAAVGCLIAGRLLLPDAGLNPAHGYALISLAHAATLRAAAGTVIYLSLIGLLALGVATIIRDTAVSIGALFALLYLPPIAAQLIQDPTWRHHIQQIAPMTAGLAIQATRKLHNLPIAPWPGLGVLATWAAAALLAGGLLLRLRDA
jgi:ABC-2 type transport system permease protein